MKKIYAALVFVVGFILLMSVFVLAARPTPASDNGLNHKGEASQLYLYEKDPVSWEIVEGGAWGKMMYKDDKFVFNGHWLMLDTGYTLIRYTDPWPGYPLVCLGEGTSDEYGDIHIQGLWKEGGNKVWLVLSSDVDCTAGKMIGWTPTEYLFEYNLI